MPFSSAAAYCALAAVTMAYGWGYRGTVGHEAGAMVPGALLGLVLCLGSGRPDWHRRAAVAGLAGAIGWAWGGSLSYMEQTFYVLSDSFPDVLYGYAVLFFLGLLWAGCGGAILGLAFTESRSELERLARPFAAVCAAFLVVYLYFLAMPGHREACETFTVRHFHDGDWLAATITLIVSAVYWRVRPKDRPAAALFFWAAVAWWLGYGVLTKLGGLRLAPLHRSESWGGVLGILAVLIVYTIRRRNRAALMLAVRGGLGGGAAFVVAVLVHNHLALRWGPFANVGLPLPAWRTAEITFGFFMGLALALGTLRLLRGGLAPPEEDCDRTRLDVFAVFAMLVALPWINSRRHAVRLLEQSPATEDTAFLGLQMGNWFILLGAGLTLPLLYVLYRYLKGDRELAPRSAFGKGAAVALLLIWMTVAAQLLDGYPSRASLLGHLCLWIPAILATCLLAGSSGNRGPGKPPEENTAPADHPRWRLTWLYAVVPSCAVVVFFPALLSLHIQEGPLESRSRLRFGPDAYWRQTARLQGTWRAVFRTPNPDSSEHIAAELPVATLEFDAYRNVAHTLPSGERLDAHRWFLKDQYFWLHWYGKKESHPERAEAPLQFREGRLYIPWPPGSGKGGYIAFERTGS